MVDFAAHFTIQIGFKKTTFYLKSVLAKVSVP